VDHTKNDNILHTASPWPLMQISRPGVVCIFQREKETLQTAVAKSIVPKLKSGFRLSLRKSELSQMRLFLRWNANFVSVGEMTARRCQSEQVRHGATMDQGFGEWNKGQRDAFRDGTSVWSAIKIFRLGTFAWKQDLYIHSNTCEISPPLSHAVRKEVHHK
jgi:hypothetical protein